MRPVYHTDDLESYLEGLEINEQICYGLECCNRLQNTTTVLVDDDAPESVKLIAMFTRRDTYEKIVPWNDPTLDRIARQARREYQYAKDAAERFELMRRVVYVWNDAEPVREELYRNLNTDWRPEPHQVVTLDDAIRTMFAIGNGVVACIDAVEACCTEWDAAWESAAQQLAG